MADEYSKARRAGEKAFKSALNEGRYPYLPALDDFLDAGRCSAVRAGIMEIPVTQITGTKTPGRMHAFACNFMPLLEKDSEFEIKWSRLYESQIEEGFRDPVLVYEYLHNFYVQEGNKRVSVARFLEMPTISADVVRLIPTDRDSENPDIYDEFLRFFAVCPLYELNFSKYGSYRRFASLLGLNLKDKWDTVQVSRIRAAYYNFAKAYAQTVQEEAGNISDALLIYLTVYGFDQLRAQSVSTIRKNLTQIRKELVTQASDENITVKEKPEEKNKTLLDTLKIIPTFNELHPLKIAFIYDRNPQNSAWVSDHEIGRTYLNKKYPKTVRTITFENCGTDEEVRDALEQAAEQDCDLVFTASPAMMQETVKAAIKHPKIHYLNCSINLNSKAVRTYYARTYEVKFLLGALAAMNAKNHKTAYIADYPIYGTIASINAFAIGASLIDPECRVYLAWSGVHDEDWFKELEYLDIDVFCGPSLVLTDDDRTLHGLCRREADGKVSNLAMPVINWAVYYEQLVKLMLEDKWDQDSQHNRAINYWWGMDAGIEDLNISSKIAYSSAKMIRLMKDGLSSGTINPFSGELRSMEKVIRTSADGRLSNEQIIRMDWLNDNVIGVIPEYSRMSEGGKKLVEAAGITKAKEKL